jgi:hypothetical protein
MFDYNYCFVAVSSYYYVAVSCIMLRLRLPLSTSVVALERF